MKLLLVEDNPQNTRLLCEKLEKTPHGEFAHEHVAHLDAALERLRQEEFEMVLLDLALPDAQGVESVIQIQQVCPALPVVVLTGMETPELTLAAMQAGAQDYLVKGLFDAELLIRSIRYAVERKHTTEELRRLNAELERRVEDRTEELRASFANTSIGFAMTRPDGRLVDANPAYCRLTGYTLDELREDSFPRWIHPADLAAIKTHIEEMLAGQATDFVIESRYIRKDGVVVRVRKSVSLIRDHANSPKWIIELVEDITLRKQTDDALRFLAQCGTSPSGEGFFHELSRYLAQALGMDFVCINRLEQEGLSARTLAIFDQGQFLDNVSYTLRNTPCDQVVGQRVYVFPRNVRGLFPNDPMLQEMNAESYLGATLWSSQGQPIGLIALISRQPLDDSRLGETILQLVAVRVADELERLEAQTRIRVLNLELENRVLKRTSQLNETITMLEAEIERRQHLEREILEISEREQCRLGQDLHDEIGQELAGTAMLGDVLTKRLLAEHHPLAGDAHKMTGHIRKTIDSTRRLAKGLYPIELARYGLLAALKDLADQTSLRSGIRCELRQRGDLPTLEPSIEIHIYRIVQEGVGNAIKHGKPSHIAIEFMAGADFHGFSVTDDGVGFEMSPALPGMGLHLMHYRARVIGAEITMEKPAQGGCRVICRLQD